MSAPNTVAAKKPAFPTHVRYNQFVKENLSGTAPETKQTISSEPPAAGEKPGEKKQITYYVIMILYNFGNAEKKSITEFKVELCKLRSDFGIQAKPAQNGKGTDYSMMTKFNMAVDEQKAVVEFFNSLYKCCMEILYPSRGAVKMPHFSKENPEASVKHPVYRPRDETTGELIDGRQPSMFFKLFKRGKEPTVVQTLFTGLDGKPIPWSSLYGSEIEYIPLILVKRIFLGVKSSIQMEMVSAVVTSLKLPNTVSSQNDTIAEINAADPMAMESVLSQIAIITAQRQDVGVPITPGAHVEPVDNAPTNAGIGERTAPKVDMKNLSNNVPVREDIANFGSLKLN